MMVYRIANSLYKDDISGTGAKLRGARWNQPGSSMLYTADSIALSTLELLVHIRFEDIRHQFHLLSIAIPDEVLIKELDAKKLKPNWQEDEEYSSFIGTEFIRSNQHLVMKVPSAVIAEAFNYLINPGHKDFKKVKLKRSKQFIFDKRLFLFK